ncbi:MAG: hypothetical protein U0359_02945 [Byssovorax sp.]
MSPRKISSIALFALPILAACGHAPEPASPPAATADTSPPPESTAADPGASAAPSGSPSASPASPPDDKAAPASDADSLARDLLKSGGRRIGYSETKGYVYPIERRTPSSFSLTLYFVSLDGQKKDPMQICQLGECEEKLDEEIRIEMPKLSARITADGYTAVRSIGWPAGSDELELAGVGLKLKYSKGRLESLRKGKPSASLAQVVGKRLDAPAIQAVFLIPGGKLLGVFAAPKGDPSGPAEDFYVFKLP